jgi:hypothetical protein
LQPKKFFEKIFKISRKSLDNRNQKCYNKENELRGRPMYFLVKNLEEINQTLLYQCVNVYGCHCEKCPYYHKALDKCESVEIFSASLENIKYFLEKNQKNIEKTLDKSN